MESKVPNVEFDKDKIDAESRTNLSSDLFDSKLREIDLAIKKAEAHLFVYKEYLSMLWSSFVLDYGNMVSIISKPLFKTLR